MAAVYAAATPLTPEQARVAERYEIQLVRAGARLEPEAKARLTAINQRLAALYTQFGQNELGDEENYSLDLAEADLDGLPEALREGAAAAAAEHGRPGRWRITNTRSSMEPFLTYSSRRDLREKGWRMWIMRGDNDDARDNKAIIAEILALRAERAGLLGFPTHAHYQLADTMAKTPEAALELIAAVWKPAVKAALADRDRVQAMIDQEGGGFKLQPWDWRYYAEKLRKAQYDVDESEVKPYLQLSKLREATFWCAGKLYGLSFEPRSDVPVYHPDVKVWAVKDAAGEAVGLFYFDPFARPGKKSGAWMSEIRSEEQFEGRVLPLVVNVCNFVKPAAGQPALLGLDDLVTTFHEFGHALHGLLSRTRYPLVAGANVSRDFVEFPSQINEHWALRPEVLERFRRPLPERPADAQAADRPHRRRQGLQPGLPDRRVPSLGLGRHGHPPGRRRRERSGRVREAVPGQARHAGRDRHAPPADPVRPYLLRRRLFGRLLRVSVVAGARQ